MENPTGDFNLEPHELFRENFKKYESGVRAEIKAAGPA